MTREQMLQSIFASAEAIADIVDDYDFENIENLGRLPDAVLHKMATVLHQAYKHLDDNLSVFQGEFDR